MKKILVLALFGLLVPFTSHGALMGFLDGQVFDEAGTLKYICFLNGDCLDKDNNQTTRAALGLSPVPTIPTTFPESTQQTVYVPVYVNPVVEQPVQQTPVTQPAPVVQTPVSPITPQVSNNIDTIEKFLSYCNAISNNGRGEARITNGYLFKDSWVSGSSKVNFKCSPDSSNLDNTFFTLVSIDVILRNNQSNTSYNNGKVTITQLSVNGQPSLSAYNIPLNYGDFYKTTIPTSGSVDFSIEKQMGTWSEMSGYSIEIGNLVIKDSAGNLFTTHPIN